MANELFNSPSIDPAGRGNWVGTMKLILTKFLAQTDDMLPAQIVSYDRATNRAEVIPLITQVTTDGVRVPRAQVASIPVLQLGAGNFVLSFPVKPGNLGWIKANDRDISIFMQSFGESAPNTQRKHSFEDALFIPDTMFQDVVINSEDEDNVVLQTLDGTQRIAIWEDRVKITSDQKIVIDAPLTEFTGAIVTGTNESYDNYAEFNGTIRAKEDVIAGYGAEDISLLHHTHDGVEPGGGNTGEPNPT